MNESIVKLLRDRYFLSNENTWEELAKRVSSIYPDIYPYIEQMKFIPSSPTLMNGGTSERLGTLSSCFPMDIEDSIEGIFDSLKECAIVTKYGGGIGVPFFRLRGSKEEIKTLNGRKSSGPLPFVSIFNEMLDGVNQAGCLIGKSLISTQEGLLYLDEIVSNKDYGWHDHSIKIDTENGIKDSKGFYCNGIANTLKITTKEGIELEGTYNHKIKVFSENGAIWKELQDVKEGDFVVIKLKSGNGIIQKLQQLDESRYNHFNENDISLPTEITEDFAFILGYLTGNGSVSSKEKDYRIVFTIPLKSYLVEDFPKKLKKVFGDISFYIQKGKGDCINIVISNKKLKEFLILNKLNKSKSNTASIPLLIRKSPISIKGMYLRGLFESDGSISFGYPQLNSSSFVLIKEVSAILFELGCPNNIFLTKHGKNCFSKEEFIHSLKILSHVGLENWKKIIGCEEESRFMECKNWKCDLSREKNYILPFPQYWFSKVLEEIDKSHYKPESHQKLKKEIKRYFRNERNFSLSSYQYLKDKKSFALNLIPEIGDFFFSKVIKIEDTGENETYDINVEDAHSYIANGIVTHNSRRGAAMGLLTIDHPCILDFIKSKKDLNKFNRLNFSVMIPEQFYKDLEKTPDKPHLVRNITDNTTHELIDSEGNIVTIKDVWNALIDNAWLVAEPGIFNKDIAYNQCTVTNINKTVVSNPCAEFVNIPYTSCALGSINLSALTEGKKFNWEEFEELIVKSTRFINNTIDKNKYPIKKIKDITTKTRPIGLGIMGLAHTLYKKEMPYNSEKAFKFTEEVIRYLTLRSMRESVDLAKENGSYEVFDYDLFIKANERFFKYKSCRNIDIDALKQDIKKYGVRNSCFTSIAPTGSISFLANVSGGIEPVFALSYSRKIEIGMKDGIKQYDVVYIGDPVFDNYLENNFDEVTKKKILKEVSENNGSCQKCKDIPDDMKKIFVVAGDLTPMEHLSILEAAAVNVSLSASKTINLPNDAKKEDVSNVFLEAYKRGIIGVTVYRDGCREGILVHDKNIKESDGIVYRDAPERPVKIPCEIHRVMYQGQKWIVFVGLLDNKPFEAFAGAIEDVCIPKNITKGYIIRQKTKHYSFEYDDEVLINNIGKSFYNKEHDAFARSISMHLQFGVPLEEILIMLNKAEGDVTHFAKVIARTLKKYVEDGADARELCPNCGSKLRYTEGCLKCSDVECSYSKCG